MADGRLRRFFGKATDVFIEAGAVIFTIWATSQVKKNRTDQDSIIAHFEGNGDTNTAPFVVPGPAQIYWRGDVDIWIRDPNGYPVEHDHVAGSDGSAFFPIAGTFFLVIASHRAEPWSVSVVPFHS
jgi:hypothetical protein